MKDQFKDGRTDLEIRTEITQRKQKLYKLLIIFSEAIMALADRLISPMNELSISKDLRANLLPEIQHEILHISIMNVAQLRHIVQTREMLIQIDSQPSSI